MSWLFLALFVLAGSYLVYVTLRSYSQLSKAERYALLALRLAALGMVLLALNGLTVTRAVNEKVCNVFVVDASRSISPTGLIKAQDIINRQIAAMGKDDASAVVVFGRDCSVISTGGPVKDLPAAARAVDGQGTCISQALRTASGLFRQGYHNRLTLLSDAQENIGSVLTLCATLAAPIDTIPIENPVAGAQISQMIVNPSIRVGQPCEVKVQLASTVAQPGKVELSIDGKPADSKQVELRKDEWVGFAPNIPAAGRHVVEAKLTTANDYPEDNVARAIVDVQGKIRVLLVDRKPAELAPAVKALKDADMDVTAVDKAGLAAALPKLADYDVLLLSDIPAEDLGKEGPAQIRNYVFNGGGLIMTGGEASFARGDYYMNPVEDALPVYMDPYKQPVLQGIVLVVDKSWSMGDSASPGANKIDLVKEAAIAAISNLRDQDFLAVVSFDSGAHVIREMKRLDQDKGAVIATIATMGSFGLTDWFGAISTGADWLEGLKIPGLNKTIVLLSDGRPSAGMRDYRGLIASRLRKMGETDPKKAADKIAFSAVGVGKDINEKLLLELAALGEGKYTRIDSETSIPKITFDDKKDPAKAVEPLFVELSLPAKPARLTKALKDMQIEKAPPLLGYNRMRPKDLAEVNLIISKKDEPLLTRWNFGAGRSIAFASDIKGRWAGDWITKWSAGYASLLVDNVRWTVSSVEKGQLQVRRDDDGAQVVLKVDDAKAQPSYPAQVYYIQADGKIGSAKLQLTAAGVGQYQASLGEPGDAYLVQATAKDAPADATSRALASSAQIYLPSRELKLGIANSGLLKQVSQLTGGRFNQPDTAFDKVTTKLQTSLRPILLALAAMLFFVEILIKRYQAVLRLFDKKAGTPATPGRPGGEPKPAAARESVAQGSQT